jgi:hypothetical protein
VTGDDEKPCPLIISHKHSARIPVARVPGLPAASEAGPARLGSGPWGRVALCRSSRAPTTTQVLLTVRRGRAGSGPRAARKRAQGRAETGTQAAGRGPADRATSRARPAGVGAASDAAAQQTAARAARARRPGGLAWRAASRGMGRRPMGRMGMGAGRKPHKAGQGAETAQGRTRGGNRTRQDKGRKPHKAGQGAETAQGRTTAGHQLKQRCKWGWSVAPDQHRCCTAAAPLLQCCTAAAVLHRCCTAVAPLWHCCTACVQRLRLRWIAAAAPLSAAANQVERRSSEVRCGPSEGAWGCRSDRVRCGPSGARVTTADRPRSWPSRVGGDRADVRAPADMAGEAWVHRAIGSRCAGPGV